MRYFIHTYTGRRFTYGAVSTLTIADIAHHLALVNRFCGATMVPYSVAQHSLIVRKILKDAGASPLLQLHGLLHDAHEAVMNDAPTPYQRWLHEEFTPEDGVDIMEQSKALLDVQIYNGLKLPPPDIDMRAQIKRADRIAFITEASQLLRGGEPDWLGSWKTSFGVEAANITITPQPWDLVEEGFYDTYNDLLVEAFDELQELYPFPIGDVLNVA